MTTSSITWMKNKYNGTCAMCDRYVDTMVGNVMVQRYAKSKRQSKNWPVFCADCAMIFARSQEHVKEYLQQVQKYQQQIEDLEMRLCREKYIEEQLSKIKQKHEVTYTIMQNEIRTLNAELRVANKTVDKQHLEIGKLKQELRKRFGFGRVTMLDDTPNLDKHINFLLRVAHPDHNAGSREAHEATIALIAIKKAMKGK